MWHPLDADLVRWLVLFEEFVLKPSAAISSELRQIEDRHGMNEKGRRDLRWRYAAVEDPKPASKRAGNVVRPERWVR